MHVQNKPGAIFVRIGELALARPDAANKLEIIKFYTSSGKEYQCVVAQWRDGDLSYVGTRPLELEFVVNQVFHHLIKLGYQILDTEKELIHE